MLSTVILMMKEKYDNVKKKLIWETTTDFTNGQASIWPEIIITFIDFVLSNFLACDERFVKYYNNIAIWNPHQGFILPNNIVSYAKGT